MTAIAPRTYRHLIANSTFITAKGKTCVFAGRKGGLGYYTTVDPGEIESLNALVAMPNVQIDLQEEAPVLPVEPIFSKQVDATIAQAAQEAAANTVLEAVPEVSKARDNLAAVIAGTKASK